MKAYLQILFHYLKNQKFLIGIILFTLGIPDRCISFFSNSLQGTF